MSAAFLRTIRGSHRSFSVVKVLTTYQEGVSPIGTTLDMVDGEVTADAEASIRGRLTLKVEGTGSFPELSTDPLTPYGNEIWVARGIEYGNGNTELVSLGYYRTTEVEQDNSPDGPIQITGLDRMSGIVDAKLEAPRQFNSGTTIADVFDTLVHEVYPAATIVFDSGGSSVLEANHVADQDRYAFLRDIAQSRGKVMFWDYAGQLRVQDPPSPTSPVFDVNYGRNGVLLALSRRLTRDGVYNAVVATGERPSSDQAPVRAVARDMNPLSPTYLLGRFGPVPRFYSSPFITTDDQAASAAEKILMRAIGLPYEASFESLVNPALEALDPVSVIFPKARRREVHVLQTVTIPLDVKRGMAATTREQSTVHIQTES